MKLFKLSLLEIKKQHFTFVLFLIISIVFFTASIFIFNFSSTVKKIGISYFIDDYFLVDIYDYKSINESLDFENSYIDNRYLNDTIILDEEEIINSRIVCSSTKLNFNDENYEMASNSHNVGDIITLSYNDTIVEVLVVSNYGDGEIYFSESFKKLSKCDILSIEVTKENNLKVIELYKKYESNFLNSGIEKYINFTTSVNYICMVLSIITIITLCIIIWNFISYLVNNNRKQIAINMAIGYKKKDVIIIYSSIIFIMFVISFILSIVFSIIVIKIVNNNIIYEIEFNILKSIIILISAILIQMILLFIKYKKIFNVTISDEIKEVL